MHADLPLSDLRDALRSQPRDQIDAYTLWRRIAIDVCQRLPTRAEVACISANGDVIPTTGVALCPSVLVSGGFTNTLE